MDSSQRDIAEDVPQYRSVMMAGPLSAPPMPRSFVSMAKAPRASNSMVKPNKPTIPAAVWDVAELPSLPAAYFLERTSVYVDCDAQVVATRICDCLRLLSIAASSDPEDKNRLSAETCDCMRFAVRLFSDDGRVVVEVQRKCGCSYEFREAARAVLRSAKGFTSPQPKREWTIPCSIPKESNEQRQLRSEDGLKVALSQLESNLADSQLVGMETLEQISRCGSKSSAAKAILEDPFLSKVTSAAQADTTSPRSQPENHVTMLKRRALTVLANALCALSESNELAQTLESISDLKSESLITSLMVTLEASAECPHEGAQAARCMQHLMTSPMVRDLLVQKEALSIAASVCAFGAQRSILLEEESRKLKMQLSSIV